MNDLTPDTIFFSLAGLISPLVSYVVATNHVVYVYGGMALFIALIFLGVPETYHPAIVLEKVME